MMAALITLISRHTKDEQNEDNEDEIHVVCDCRKVVGLAWIFLS